FFRLFTILCCYCIFFFSSRRRHTRFSRDWSSDVCSSDLNLRHEFIGISAMFSSQEFRRFETITCDSLAYFLGNRTVGVLFKFMEDRKSTRLNSSHVKISYAVFCLKKKKHHTEHGQRLLTA